VRGARSFFNKLISFVLVQYGTLSINKNAMDDKLETDIDRSFTKTIEIELAIAGCM